MMSAWILKILSAVMICGGIYVLGGVTTIVLSAVLLRNELAANGDRPESREILKVFLLWPGVVGMGVLFGLITIASKFRNRP